jgi:hypothetical protein
VLITPHFVFVHLPKTGGTFIERICREHLKIEHETPNIHEPVGAIPPEYSELPVFTLIRNPWDWYVSWWHHARQFEPFWGWEEVRDLPFPDAVRLACGIGLTSSAHWATTMRKFDCDYYSMLWQRTFRAQQRRGLEVEVGRQENLRGDFLSFLDRHRVPGDALRRAVLHAEPVNPSQHDGYRDYYDDALRNLVSEKARRIVRTYGYEF